MRLPEGDKTQHDLSSICRSGRGLLLSCVEDVDESHRITLQRPYQVLVEQKVQKRLC